MMILLNAYSQHSKSANELADSMKVPINGKIIQLVRPSADVTIVNWGDGDAAYPNCRVLNKPEAVQLAVNKLKSFQKFREAGVRTPDWTTDINVARGWLPSGRVVARQRVKGRDGDGLTIHSALPLPQAKLYTRFIPGATEYRVSVVNGRVIASQVKVPIQGKQHNHDVKTTGGGYGLHYQGRRLTPQSVRNEAVRAVAALGLDFGGVDVLWTAAEGAFVLEVNTAPELTPLLRRRYAESLLEVCYATTP